MKTISTIMLSIIAVGLSFGQGNGTWTSRAPIPVPRMETTPAVLNGKIYVVGGFIGTDSGALVTTLMHVYDPGTNTWSTAASAPRMMHHLGFAPANGRLYLLGGYSATSPQSAQYTPTNFVYEYNPGTNTWAAKTSIPVGRGAHVAIPYQNKIYLFGGIDDVNGGSPRTDIYDPATDSWSQGANLPTVREHVSGAAVDSLLYVVGGQNADTNSLRVVEAYSPASNQWYTVPQMPVGRHSPTVTALGGRLYVIGGEAGSNPDSADSRITNEYNPATQTWRTLTSRPHGHSHCGGGTVGSTIYALGGSATNSTRAFKMSEDNYALTVSGITGVDNDPTGTPQRTMLMQNYPNPFNPQTTISFHLAKQDFVQLRIFNMLGNEVTVLLNRELESGDHSITWDARNVPSGVYYYRLQTSNSIETRSMIVTK